jgi:hypothetical protein
MVMDTLNPFTGKSPLTTANKVLNPSGINQASGDERDEKRADGQADRQDTNERADERDDERTDKQSIWQAADERK